MDAVASLCGWGGFQSFQVVALGTPGPDGAEIPLVQARGSLRLWRARSRARFFLPGADEGTRAAACRFVMEYSIGQPPPVRTYLTRSISPDPSIPPRSAQASSIRTNRIWSFSSNSTSYLPVFSPFTHIS